MSNYTYNTENEDFCAVLDELDIDSDQTLTQKAWDIFVSFDYNVEDTVYHYENNAEFGLDGLSTYDM